MNPLITIVVAVYNGANVLQKCINSIAEQSYRSWELIIIDGGSSDNTKEIIKRNEVLIKYWESERDRGIAHAWNKALKQANGEWILFLGADDQLHDPEALNDAAYQIMSNAEQDIIYGKIIFEGGQFDGLTVGQEGALRAIKRRMSIPHTAAFHNKNFFQNFGEFDETYKIAMDYEILLRKKNLSIKYINRIITRMGGTGISSRLAYEALKEGKRAQLQNKVESRFKIKLLYAIYIIRQLIKIKHKSQY